MSNMPEDAFMVETGGGPPNGKEVEYRFGRYVVTVKVGSDGRFVGITRVSARRDFLSPSQRARSRAHHDVSEFYEPE